MTNDRTGNKMKIQKGCTLIYPGLLTLICSKMEIKTVNIYYMRKAILIKYYFCDKIIKFQL